MIQIYRPQSSRTSMQLNLASVFYSKHKISIQTFLVGKGAEVLMKEVAKLSEYLGKLSSLASDEIIKNASTNTHVSVEAYFVETARD